MSGKSEVCNTLNVHCVQCTLYCLYNIHCMVCNIYLWVCGLCLLSRPVRCTTLHSVINNLAQLQQIPADLFTTWFCVSWFLPLQLSLSHSHFFLLNQPFGPIQSLSCNVRQLCDYASVCVPSRKPRFLVAWWLLVEECLLYAGFFCCSTRRCAEKYIQPLKFQPLV